MMRRQPSSPLFPYTTLFRSRDAELRAESRNQTVTIPDILTTLTASVWAEAGVQGSQRARNTTSIRRDLRSEEHTSELQSLTNLVCRLLLEKKKNHKNTDERL